MKQILLIIGIILIASGCIDNSICGTYTFEDSKLILQDDGTYLYYPHIDDTAQKGKYTTNHNEIQITNILGMTTILKTTNSGLIDDEGNVWRKQDVKLQNTSAV